MDVIHDADHVIGVVSGHENLADSVFARPIDVSRGGIDEDNLFAVHGVGPGEVTTTETDPHRANKSGSYDIDER